MSSLYHMFIEKRPSNRLDRTPRDVLSQRTAATFHPLVDRRPRLRAQEPLCRRRRGDGHAPRQSLAQGSLALRAVVNRSWPLPCCDREFQAVLRRRGGDLMAKVPVAPVRRSATAGKTGQPLRPVTNTPSNVRRAAVPRDQSHEPRPGGPGSKSTSLREARGQLRTLRPSVAALCAGRFPRPAGFGPVPSPGPGGRVIAAGTASRRGSSRRSIGET